MKTTREALAEAFAEADEPELEPGDGDGAVAVEVEPGAGDRDEGGDEGGREDGGDEEVAAGEDGKGPKRDPATGKFAKAAAEAEPGTKPGAARAAPGAKAAAQPGQAAQEGQQQPASLKPPQDWRPAAKEKWATLPREVQEESIRLHVETKKVLDQGAQARQVAEAYTRATQPYEHMFRAVGRTPVQGVEYLMQTYAALQTAPLGQRAQLLGGMVRDFLGTDEGAINLLAAALEGKAAAAGGTQSQAGIRPEQLESMLDQRLAARDQQARAAAETKAINDFEATAPEFLNAVTQEMLALVTIDKRQGKTVTPELLKAAYDKAVRINPETAAILKQRDDAVAAKKRQESAGKNRAAASGLKNEPPGPGGAGAGKARSTREQLAHEFAKAESGSRV